MKPKFRAYDKQMGQMFNVRELILNKDSVRAVRVIGQTSKSRYKKSDFMYSDRFELMQWTGLKDKNGVEIYDGDIVITHRTEYTHDAFAPGWIFGVDWTPGNGTTVGWWLYGIGEYDTNYPVDYSKIAMHEFAFSDIDRYLQPTNLDAFEVIGNIHENPELLK